MLLSVQNFSVWLVSQIMYLSFLILVAESNFDMIFTANQTSQYVRLRDFSQEIVESFTLALWVRTISSNAVIFYHGRESHLHLRNADIILGFPASLTVVVQGSVKIYISLREFSVGLYYFGCIYLSNSLYTRCLETLRCKHRSTLQPAKHPRHRNNQVVCKKGEVGWTSFLW